MKKLVKLALVLFLLVLVGCSSVTYKSGSEPERHPGHPGHELHCKGA